MSDLRTRVRSISNSTTTETSDAQIDDFLNEASKLVVSAMPKELLWPFATKSSNVTDGNGFTFTTGQAADSILLVMRNGKKCDWVAPELIYAMQSSSGSIFEPTASFPKCYIEGNTVYIKPNPTSSQVGNVYHVYPPVPTGTDNTWALSSLEGALIYYAASMDFTHLSGYYRNQAVTELGSLSNYTKPTFTVPTFPTITDIDLSTTNANIDSVTAPSVGSVSYTNASATGVSTVTVATLMTAPTYSKPVFSAPTFPTIAALTLPVAPTVPTVGSVSYSSASATAATATTVSSTSTTAATATTISGLGPPPIYTDPSVAGATEGITAALTALTSDSIGTDADFLDFSKWFTAAAELIEDEKDPELASLQLRKITAYLTAYTNAMQNQLYNFNEDNARYQAELQHKIQQAQVTLQEKLQDVRQSDNAALQTNLEQARVTLQEKLQDARQADVVALQNKAKTLAADIQNDITKLQKYANEVSSYQAEVNAVVQKWVQEEMQNKFRRYITDYANSLQEYNLNIQNNFNDFRRANTEYQADIQTKIKNAEIAAAEARQEAQQSTDIDRINQAKALEASIQNDLLKLQKYSGDIQKFQSQVDAEYKEWQLNNIVNAFNKWVKDYDGKLQEFALDVQNENNRALVDNRRRIESANEYNQLASFAIRKAEQYYTWGQKEVDKYIKNNSQTVRAERAILALQGGARA